MQKPSTRRLMGNRNLKGHQLTIGLDLGDRWSFYCVLNELGDVLPGVGWCWRPGHILHGSAGF